MKRDRTTAGDQDVDDDFAAIKDVAAKWKARADAGLSQPEEAELQAWLEADPRHRAALARFDSVWEKFDRPFHAGVSDQLLEALEVRAGRRRRRQVISTVTGLMVLIAAGSVWRFAHQSDAAAPTDPVAASLSTHAVLLMPARQTLPDGSVVELKEGADIAVDFSPSLRRVVLRRGEAHFQVTKDATRTFVVAAGGVEARAVGTAFAVQLGTTAVEVLVTEGHVAVNQAAAAAPVSASSQAPAAPEPLAVLGVSDRVVVNLSAQSVSPPQVTAVQPAELDERLAWRAPRVEFTRTSLADAVAVLNRYSAGRRSAGEQGVHFVIADAALSDVRVSGLFRVDRTEAFVGLLKNGFGIAAEPRGDGEILLHRISAPRSP